MADEDTPLVERQPNDAISDASDEILNTPLPPVPGLAERYTALFVAASEGREYDNYGSLLRDPDNRDAMEGAIVASLGEVGEAYRDLIRQTLDDLAAGTFGYLPDPQQVNIGTGADPVQLFTGEFLHECEDLHIDGAGIEFVFRRTYRNQVTFHGPMGANWDHGYNVRLREGNGEVMITTGELREQRYVRHETYGYFVPPDGVDAVVEPVADSFQRRETDGTRHVFTVDPTTARSHRLDRVVDRFGNFLQFSYLPDERGLLDRVLVNHSARVVRFAYDEQGRITAVADHTNRTWRYGYDDFGDLVAVSTPPTPDFPDGLTTTFDYNTAAVAGLLRHNLTRITDGAGRIYLENSYGESPGDISFDRVIAQRQGSGVTLFDYEDVAPIVERDYTEAQRPAHQVTVTERNGQLVHQVFNRFGNLILREERVIQSGVPRLLVERRRYNADGRLTASLTPEGVLTQHQYGRDEFIRRNGLDDESQLTAHNELTSNVRLGFGLLRATVRRAKRIDFATMSLARAVWDDFPDIVGGFDSDEEDMIVKFGYEPDFGQLVTASDPRFTASAEAGAVGEDPRYEQALTRYAYDGPPLDRHRFLVEISRPAPTLADGTPGERVIESFRNEDGTPGYDSRGRLVRRVGPTGTVTEYSYVPPNSGDPREGYLQRTVVDPEGLAITTEYQHDELGRVVATRLPRATAGDERFVTRTVHNDLDQVVETIGSLPFGLRVRRYYDRGGQLAREERVLLDEAGNPTLGGLHVRTFCYDEELRLIEERAGGAEPDTQLGTTHCYDAAGRRVLTILPRGNRVRYRYDERGLLVGHTIGAGTGDAATTRTEYDGDGRVRRGLDARGNPVESSYDAFGRLVAQRDPLGVVIRHDYDKLGNLTVQRVFQPRADGYLLISRSQTEYDELGRPIRRAVSIFDNPPDPVPEAELMTAFRDPPGQGRLLVTQLLYDAGGRLVSTVDPLDRATTTEYDPLDRPVSTVDPAGNRSEQSYDAHGNLLRRDQIEVILDPQTGAAIESRFFATSFRYDELDRRTTSTDSLGSTTRYQYDSRGNQVVRIDPLGNTVRTEFDLHNRRTAVLLELTPSGLGGGPTDTTATTRFEYDPNGNLALVTDAMTRQTVYRYDPLDRQRGMVFPDGSQASIDYDADGNVIATQDNNGVRRGYSVDAVGRTFRVDIDRSSLPLGESMHGATFEQYRHDGLGRLVGADNDFTRTETRYNSLGWPLADTTSVVAPEAAVSTPLIVQRQFNDAGSLIGMTYPNGRRLEFARDALDRLTSVSNVENGIDYPGDSARPEVSEVARIQYAGRRRVRCTYGNSAAIDYAHDAGGRLIEIAHSSTSGPMLAIQYLFDAVSNVRLRQDVRSAGTRGEAFGYDSIYRLVNEASSAPTPIDAVSFAPPNARIPQVIPDRQADMDRLIGPLTLPPAPRTYDYDQVGNRISERLPAGGRVEYTVNGLDQYTVRDSETFVYDNNGNLRNSGRMRCDYDSQNRLVGCEIVTGDQQASRFLHDVLGRRALDISGGTVTQFVWDGANLIAEYRDGAVLALYVHDDSVDRPLQIAVGGREHWYHADVVGSVRLLTDSAGTQSAEYRYSAFGATVEESGNGGINPLRYAGRRLDSSGTYDFRAREYDPQLGRFLQRDPLGTVNGTNVYDYAINNPLTVNDPFGTDARPEINDPAVEAEGWTDIPRAIVGDLLRGYGERRVQVLERDLGVRVSVGPPGPNDVVLDPNRLFGDALLDKLTGGLLSRRSTLVAKQMQETLDTPVVFAPGREHLNVLGDANISAATKAAVTAWGIQQQRKGGIAGVLGTVARLTGEHWDGVNTGLGIARDVGFFGAISRWSGARTAGAAGAAPEASATLSESEHAMRVAAKLGFEPEGRAAGFYTGLAGKHGGPLSDAAGVSRYFDRLRLGGTVAETWGGAYLNALERQGLKLDRPLLDAMSSSYAWSVADAGGRAILLRTGAVRAGSIWTRLEAPILRTGNVPIQVHLRVFQQWEPLP